MMIDSVFRRQLIRLLLLSLACACLAPKLAQGQEEPDADMVFIPPGVFLMGADASYDDQRPRHEVALDAFWIDRYEVSNADYAVFLNVVGNQIEGGVLWYNPDGIGSRIVEVDGYYKVIAGYEDHPAVNVTWYGARAYAKWRNKRLPTEAEWEKAASWETVIHKKRKWPWGDSWDTHRLNCWEGVHQLTVPVSSYPAGVSPYGIYNMAGNVWEWCADWYNHKYYFQSPPENPKGPAVGQYRSIRGGSWNNYSVFTSTTYRSISLPNMASFDVGFRCAK